MKKFAIILAVLSVTIALGYAEDEDVDPSPVCICPQSPISPPLVCRTKYLMLVRITSSINDPLNNRRIYGFTLLRDISRGGVYSTTFNYIETPLTQCRQDLVVGKNYLLGGAVDIPNQRLFINKCSYVQLWTHNPGSLISEAALQEILEKCSEYPIP